MIELKEVTFSYPGAKSKSLDAVSFAARSGECVLITGESGCGKTTLTRILNGLCPKFYGGQMEGDYTIEGEEVREKTLDEMGRVLASVFQDPRSQFFAKRVQDEIVLAMENHCIDRESMHTRLETVCELLGITHLLGREMTELSSGEKQKVAIASVCALRPKGLVLDEPSANLDTAATAHMANLLSQLKREGHTIIVSEHRLHYLKDIFDRLLVMQDGKIVREYSRAEALALSENELEKLGLRFFEVPQLQVEGRIHTYEQCRVRAERVSLRLNDIQILNDITLGCRNGHVTAITGSNGAGKTSICRIIAGMLREGTGAVMLDDSPVRRKKRVRSSFFVQQDVDYQLYMPTVKEEILLGSKLAPEEERVQHVIAQLSLDTLLARHPNTLSGGQKQRVLLAAASIRSVPLLVLDEPTSGLDGHHMRVVSQIIRELANQGRAVLLITHDLEFISLVADSIVYMNDGKAKYHSYIG